MIDQIITMWFILMFIALVPIVYKALTAIDFSKMFRPNSSWQIRLLVLLFAIIIAFLVSFAFKYLMELIIAGISK